MIVRWDAIRLCIPETEQSRPGLSILFRNPVPSPEGGVRRNANYHRQIASQSQRDAGIKPEVSAANSGNLPRMKRAPERGGGSFPPFAMLFGVRLVHHRNHPADAEPVLQNPEFRGPKSLRE